MISKIYDLVGIGVGPANLGLAALLKPIKKINALFVERKKQFCWHNGVTLKNSDLQVHYLKDLVTLVDPTNPYSFLAYLAENKRIYQFLNQNKTVVSRKEYEKYYQWVSTKLDSLKFNTEVNVISYTKKFFKITLGNEDIYAKHIALGVGKELNIPPAAMPYFSADVMHSYNFNLLSENYQNKDICIVGGGQSAAEIIYEMMTSEKLPRKIYWINRHYRYLPLEDSCFSNEYYTPSFCKHFYHKDANTRDYLLKTLNDTNNGITLDLLDKIYHRAYELKFLTNVKFELVMMPAQSFLDMKKWQQSYNVIIKDTLNSVKSNLIADKVIFCTGYKNSPPRLLKNILGTLPKHCVINQDFSLSWNNENINKIYIQNDAADYFGLADTNLGIFTWRNATIINSLLNYKHYNDTDSSLILTDVNSNLSTIKRSCHEKF